MVRFDFIKYVALQISPEVSPEITYWDEKLRERIEMSVEGVITGLSYQERGLNFEKIEKNFVCGAMPSQDLFLDYQNFLWIYNEVVIKRKG